MNERTKTRHLAVVTTSYPLHEDDADGHFVRTAARAHRSAGLSVTVLAPERGGRTLNDDVTLVELPGGRAFSNPGLRENLRQNPARSLDAMRFCVALERTLAGLACDALEVHWPFPIAFAIPRRLRGVPTTFVSHGACVRALLACPRPLRNLLIASMVRPSVRWGFVSDDLRSSLLSSLSPRNATSVQDASFIEAAPMDLPRPQDLGPAWSRPAYVIVGRLIASKRVDRALAYAAQLAHIRDNDVVLIGDGPMRDELLEKARALGLRIHATGQLPRRETLGILAGSSGLLFASQTEGLSTVVREAQHYGVPVIDAR